MGRLLVVHDDAGLRETLGAEHSLLFAGGLEEAKTALSRESYEAVLVGERLRDGGVPEILGAVREKDLGVAIILLAAGATPSLLTESSRQGVWGLFIEPYAAASLQHAVRRACEHTALVRECKRLREQAPAITGAPGGNGALSADQPHNGHGDSLRWIEDLPDRLDLRSLLSSVEKALIEKTLKATEGAQAEAARRLGLSRSDLSYKLAKYDLRKSSV